MNSPKINQATVNEETEFLASALRAEADAITRLAQRVIHGDAEKWLAALDLLGGCTGHVVVSGMGKSGQVGAKISSTFSSLGQPSSFVHPAEAVHGDLGRLRGGDVVMLLSYSGNTDEVLNLALLLRQDGVPRLGVTSSHASPLARLCDVHLAIGDVTEACPLNLAPTTSTTVMLAVGDALALGLSRRRDFKEDDFHKHHPGGMLGFGLQRVTEALRFRVGYNLPVVNQNVSVREACGDNQSGRRAGAILLVDDAGRLTGIFTDGDLRRLVLRDKDGMSRAVREVMTARPRHLLTDSLVRDAVRMVQEHRVDEIPVVDADGKPVGLIDIQDLVAMKVVRE